MKKEHMIMARAKMKGMPHQLVSTLRGLAGFISSSTESPSRMDEEKLYRGMWSYVTPS